MIPRTLLSTLLKSAEQYPVVTLIGPRQSGKTSLVKMAFKALPYYNLESPDIRAAISADPNAFLASCAQGAILDEIQNVPELLSYIQVIVDEKKQNGLFILTGSHQLSLNQAITQSLAGRTAILNLFPLSIAELNQSGLDASLDEFTFKGLYPKLYDVDIDPTTYYRNYFHTYVERDVRQLINIKDRRTFENFMRLLAGRVGQMLNLTNIGNELGVSHTTIKNWLSLLEASFIVYRLEPYHTNISKRIVKTPKYYFVDSGLAAYLLGIENLTHLSRDPLRGNLIENLMVMECVKARQNIGRNPNLYFYRDNMQNEVDLIYQQGHALIPIEIKASATFNSRFLKGLDYFQKIFETTNTPSYLVYAGEITHAIQGHQLLNFRDISRVFE